jgi:hypothetical protein
MANVLVMGSPALLTGARGLAGAAGGVGCFSVGPGAGGRAGCDGGTADGSGRAAGGSGGFCAGGEGPLPQAASQTTLTMSVGISNAQQLLHSANILSLQSVRD